MTSHSVKETDVTKFGLAIDKKMPDDEWARKMKDS